MIDSIHNTVMIISSNIWTLYKPNSVDFMNFKIEISAWELDVIADGVHLSFSNKKMKKKIKRIDVQSPSVELVDNKENQI